MKLPRIIVSVAILFIASLGLFAWHRANYQADLCRPHLIEGAGPNWLFVSRSKHVTVDASTAHLIGDWVTSHQAGWQFGSLDDFDPDKTQLLCDGCGIEIDGDRIVLTYDEVEHDPDSVIYIKRVLSPDEQTFWRGIISQIKTPNPEFLTAIAVASAFENAMVSPHHIYAVALFTLDL